MPFYSTDAHLWDGTNQLSGQLELWESKIIFRLEGFEFSHLNLSIAFSDIEKIEPYLVFNLAKNGLRIQSREGKFDLFVLEDIDKFKKNLSQVLNKFNSKNP